MVAGTVKYARLNFLVPVPEVRDFEELNAFLEQCCRGDLRRRVRGHVKIKEQLLRAEQLSVVARTLSPRLPVESSKRHFCSSSVGNTDLLKLVPGDSTWRQIWVYGCGCQGQRVSPRTRFTKVHGQWGLCYPIAVCFRGFRDRQEPVRESFGGGKISGRSRTNLNTCNAKG